jgi:hypothetical protein
MKLLIYTRRFGIGLYTSTMYSPFRCNSLKKITASFKYGHRKDGRIFSGSSTRNCGFHMLFVLGFKIYFTYTTKGNVDTL